MSDPNRKEYLHERDLLIKAEAEMSNSFDKAMITLSAGALGLSISFTEKLIDEAVKHPIFLILAWIGFCAALFFILTSFLLSQAAMRNQRDVTDKQYQDPDYKEDNVFGKITMCLNVLSLISFIFGTVTLVVFSVLNI